MSAKTPRDFKNVDELTAHIENLVFPRMGVGDPLRGRAFRRTRV
jgi:hypothetical protein